MGIINWMKAKKQKSKEKRQAKLERKIGGGSSEILLDGDTSEIKPPETRFTEDYRQFLEQQRAEAEALQNEVKED